MRLSIVIKKAIVILLPFLFLSCEKLDDIRLQRIGSIPVSDAAYIFKRSGNTKAISNENLEGVWKITQSGEEVRLTVLNNKGEETKIEINSVANLSENFLLIATEVGRVLVDKKTDKVYQCPDNLRAEVRFEEYPAGTIYYSDGPHNKRIYKAQISTQSIKEEMILPEGQNGVDFFIGQNETIYYVVGTCYEGGGKIMTKNKRLYPTEYENMVFGSADHNIYSINRDIDIDSEGYEIYKWENLSENEIDKRLICTIPCRGISDFAPINTASGNVILFVGNKVYEFDGKSCILKREYSPEESYLLGKLHDNISYLNGYGWMYKTVDYNNVYFDHNPGSGGNEDIAVSIDPITYELTPIPYTIPENEYEVYSKQTDAFSGKLLFTALRYSDSSIVLGEVDSKGNVNIKSEKKSTYHISEYFALN